MRLPSTITVCVSPPQAHEWRLLGMKAPTASALTLGALISISAIAYAIGVNEWVTVALNVLALIVPAVVLLSGTNTTLAVLRASRRWERDFLVGFRLAVGPEARVENLHHVLLSLQQGSPCRAEVEKSGAREHYTAVGGVNEVVLLRDDAIEAEWAELNAALEQGS